MLKILVKPDLSAEQSKKIDEKVKKAIGEAGGRVLKTESLGVKSLAYPVENFEQARFGGFSLELPPEGVSALRRDLEREGDLLRVMVLSA